LETQQSGADTWVWLQNVLRKRDITAAKTTRQNFQSNSACKSAGKMLQIRF
jgi:hypothetical protein